MNSVPERPTLADADRLLAQLDERELAAGLDILMRLLRMATGEAAQPERQAEKPEAGTKPPRTRRSSPSRLAKWEAQWQAEQDAEAESRGTEG